MQLFGSSVDVTRFPLFSLYHHTNYIDTTHLIHESTRSLSLKLLPILLSMASSTTALASMR